MLVTGAAGWLGSRLVQALVGGVPDYEDLAKTTPDLRVRCLVLPHEDTSLIDGDKVEIIRGDITRSEDCAAFCEGAEGAIAFHTAGVIHPRRRVQFYQVNVHGTRNILDACVSAWCAPHRGCVVELTLRH